MGLRNCYTNRPVTTEGGLPLHHNREFLAEKIVLLWSMDRVDLLIRFKCGKFGSGMRKYAVNCLYCVYGDYHKLYNLMMFCRRLIR